MNVVFMKRFFPHVILISWIYCKSARVVFMEYKYATTSCINVHVWEIAIWSFRGK